MSVSGLEGRVNVVKPVVLVCDGIEAAGLVPLEGVAECHRCEGPEPDPERLAEATALLVRSATRVTAEMLGRAPRLKVVARAGVGVDNIDVEAATRRGVLVINAPDGNTIAASEHTLALMMALVRRIPEADQRLKAGGWDRKQFVGVELAGRRLGVLGLGRIGRRVARVARALEMDVVAYDPFLPDDRALELGIPLMSFEELLRTADIVSLHLPKTPQTLNLLNREALSWMKPGARLVNAARGGIVDELALADCIAAGRLAGAALDVFAAEPLGDSPLRGLGGKVVLTPHLGASTEEAQAKVALDVAQQVRDYLAGDMVRSAVNLPSLPADVSRRVAPFAPPLERLGALVAQLAPGAISRVEVQFSGRWPELPFETLVTAVLKGWLAVGLGETVNWVNARMLAKERGIEVGVRQLDEGHDRDATVLVRASGGVDDASSEVILSWLGDGHPRLVGIEGHCFSLPLEGWLLLAPHGDVPGAVGLIATLLGRHGVNISGLQLDRLSRGGRAMLALAIDEEATAEVLAAVPALPGFGQVRQARL
ncbi:MAG: phosphoglycerate dehydrogenase [Candidatus Sericytochromatia bacterium]|nr:phosphoglycerate dehydrogenase [Candidatus Sericytochromatia bacterium]